MNSDAVTTGKSLLEKPLSLLTEDDIAQITREECRRFLKDRGMRRPSWNKSQAIQQVISLKALFENRSDLEDPSGSVRIARIGQNSSPSPPQISLPSPTMNAIGSGDSRSVPSPYRRKDPIPPLTAGDVPCLLPLAGKSQQSNFPPSRGFSDGSSGQLTIFFAGKVSVYDGVPPAKAREIMQLAANPDKDDATTVALLNRFAPVYTGPPGVARCCDSPAGKWQRNVEEGRASRESVPECPTSRKASLKRYREKRKDRYKGRRKFCGSSSSSMELMHLSQKFSGPGPIEPSSRSNSSSSMQPRPPWSPPLSRCTSIETKKLGFSVDLNDDGAGGH